MLMEDLEGTSGSVYNAYFVDLFVRASNTWVSRWWWCCEVMCLSLQDVSQTPRC
jgi:hypothetical protein